MLSAQEGEYYVRQVFGAKQHVMSFFLLLRRPPTSPLFPYTTLFRSDTQPVDNNARPSFWPMGGAWLATQDRKSTRLNSSHLGISYAVFCLKKKTGPGRRRHRRGERASSHPPS